MGGDLEMESQEKGAGEGEGWQEYKSPRTLEEPIKAWIKENTGGVSPEEASHRRVQSAVDRAASAIQRETDAEAKPGPENSHPK